VFFQMALIGPMFGQAGFFHKIASKEIEDKRSSEHQVNESKRLLDVLERRLDGRDWIMGEDDSIADSATLGRVNHLIAFHGARELVEYDKLSHVSAWLEHGVARPAVQRGLQIPGRD
jgi:GST-like protein